MAEKTAAPAEDDVARYELPTVESMLLGDFTEGASMSTTRQVEALHKRAYGEGFEAGRADGYAAGEANAADDVSQHVAALNGILSDLREPLAELDRELVASVADLAILIAKLLVRRELKTEPGEVVGVVRETIKHLPVASRGLRLRLNPDDLDLVRDALALGGDTLDWQLEADPLIARGGCIVETESSRIDASIETRIAAIASKMLGGERESDRDS